MGAMGPQKLLQLSQIGKSFGAVRVLDGISLDLNAGEVHILAGENGAGKSTLIKILAGIHPDYDGTIELAGRPVRFATPHEANRQGISVIHQEMSLVDSMSVADNVLLGREPARLGGAWLDRAAQSERVLALCRQLGLTFTAADLARPVEQFSLSIKNRIEIAKALAFDARILVMDEPTSALDRAEAEKLFILIEALKRRGCGIIYISHKMEEIYRVADRITVLRDGRWVGTAPVQECPEPKLIQWMIGRGLSEYIPSRIDRPRMEGKRPRIEIQAFRVPNPDPSRADAVRNFSASVHAGEIVGVAGLQGAGGSELFQGLFGAYGGVCSGRVWIDGEPFRPRRPGDSIRRGLAHLTADRKSTGLVLGLSVEQNVSLASLSALSPGGWLRPGLERQAATRQVGTLRIRLASLGQEAGTLSGGNQQKLVLAKWLETRPKVLLLEEPTRGVDIGTKHEIYSLMNQWSEEGLAILLISTDLLELLGLSDRIIVLHRGEITAFLDRGDATPEKILAAAMGSEAGGGRDVGSRRPARDGLTWGTAFPEECCA